MDKCTRFFYRVVSFLTVEFKSSLSILGKSLLSEVSFASLFSQSVTYLLILLALFFTEQKFLLLIKSSLSIISFIGCAFGVASKNHGHTQGRHKFSPMLSSGNFIVFHFTLRAMIHFGLIMVKGVKSASRSNFFVYGCSSVPTPYVEKAVFALLYCLVPLSKVS